MGICRLRYRKFAQLHFAYTRNEFPLPLPSVFASLRRDWYNRAGRCAFITRNGSRRSEPMRTKTGKIMYYVYILQSITFPDKFYIGYTDDLKRRLAQHNNEHVGYTNKYRPWKIKNYFALDDKQKAKDFEKYLKSQCGREFIKKHF